MTNFLNIKENDIKFEKKININLNERCRVLTQLNHNERKEAVQYIGTDHVYRFDLTGTLIDNNETFNFGGIIDIMADSYNEAEQAANDYFVATHIDGIKYYQNKSQTCSGCSCSFRLTSLYTQEEANEANSSNSRWEDIFSELELCSTL